VFGTADGAYGAANALLDGWGLAGHEIWTVPMASRHPVAGVLRTGAKRLSRQPG